MGDGVECWCGYEGDDDGSESDDSLAAALARQRPAYLLTLQQGRTLSPTHYAIRRGGGLCMAQSWVLEGLRDAAAVHDSSARWVELARHRDDTSLCPVDSPEERSPRAHDYRIHTWPVQAPGGTGAAAATAVACSTPLPSLAEDRFCSFRVRMTSPGHDGNWYLSISALELYGFLHW